MEPVYEYVRGQGWIISPEVKFLDTTWDVWDSHAQRYFKKRVRLFARPAFPGEYSRSKPRGYCYDIGGKPNLTEWACLDATEYWSLVSEPVVPESENLVYCAMVYL